MVIAGEWIREEDDVIRPMVEIGVLVAGRPAVLEPFLVDTGADCTVLSARLLAKLALPPDGFLAGSVLPGTVRGNHLATAEPTALDLSVLGRDVLASFDVTVSQRRNEVLLLIGEDNYTVTS